MVDTCRRIAYGTELLLPRRSDVGYRSSEVETIARRVVGSGWSDLTGMARDFAVQQVQAVYDAMMYLGYRQPRTVVQLYKSSDGDLVELMDRAICSDTNEEKVVCKSHVDGLTKVISAYVFFGRDTHGEPNFRSVEAER